MTPLEVLLTLLLVAENVALLLGSLPAFDRDAFDHGDFD